MKLSTKGRYAARAILDLAIHSEKGPVLLKEIAKRQEISDRYLERIMATLVSAGLVRSLRGQRGGFTLARTPKEILLSDVVQAVEGSLCPVACVDDPKLCHRVNICVTRDIWKKLKKAILDVLESITLEDMIEMQKKKPVKPEHKMYYI